MTPTATSSFLVFLIVLFFVFIEAKPTSESTVDVRVGILEVTSRAHQSHLLVKPQLNKRYPNKTALTISFYHEKPLKIHLELDADFIAADFKLLDHHAESNVTAGGSVAHNLLCFYRGTVEGHRGSYVTLNMCESPRGRIEIPEHGNLHLEPSGEASSRGFTHKVTRHSGTHSTLRLHRRSTEAPKVILAKMVLAVDIDHVKALGPWLMGAVLAFMHGAATFFPGGVVPVHDNVFVKIQFTHVIRATQNYLIPDGRLDYNVTAGVSELELYSYKIKTLLLKNLASSANFGMVLKRQQIIADFANGYADTNSTCGSLSTGMVFGDLNVHATAIFAHEMLHLLGASHIHQDRASSDTCRASEDVFTTYLLLNNLSECTLSDLRRSYESKRFVCFEVYQPSNVYEITANDVSGQGGDYVWKPNDRMFFVPISDTTLPEHVQPLKWAYATHGLFKNYMIRFFNSWNFNLGKAAAWLTGFVGADGDSVPVFKNSPLLDNHLPVLDRNGAVESYSRPSRRTLQEFYRYQNMHREPQIASTFDPSFQKGNVLRFRGA